MFKKNPYFMKICKKTQIKQLFCCCCVTFDAAL